MTARPFAVAATGVALGAGWVWPVFTNFGIVRTNPDAAGRSTGITQMGVYVGVFAGPLLTGRLIDAHGFATMWIVVAGSAVLAAAVSYHLANDF